MDRLTMCFDVNMYPKEALLKAAYFFIDRYYLHLEKGTEHFCVVISSKEGKSLPGDIEKQFENELLSQTIRYQVYQETHNIREMIVARAMASTIVVTKPEYETAEGETGDQDVLVKDIDHIFKDWYANEAK